MTSFKLSANRSETVETFEQFSKLAERVVEETVPEITQYDRNCPVVSIPPTFEFKYSMPIGYMEEEMGMSGRTMGFKTSAAGDLAERKMYNLITTEFRAIGQDSCIPTILIRGLSMHKNVREFLGSFPDFKTVTPEMEADFIVFSPKHGVIIFEVKNVESDKVKKMKERWEEAKKQALKDERFIQGVAEKIGFSDLPFIKVGALLFQQDTKKEISNEDGVKFFKVTDDPEKFHQFILENVTQGFEMTDDQMKKWQLLSTLLTLLRVLVVAKAKAQIAKELIDPKSKLRADFESLDREGYHRSAPKNVAKTFMSKITDRFGYFLNLQQMAILNGPNRQILIGPFGSGKTLLLQLKILELAEKKERVLVLLPSGFLKRLYSDFLEKADRKHSIKNLVTLHEYDKWGVTTAPLFDGYDHIFFDEATSLERITSWSSSDATTERPLWEFLENIFEKIPGAVWMAFYDHYYEESDKPTMSAYSCRSFSGTPQLTTMISTMKDSYGFHLSKLHRNYRNTLTISELMVNLAGALKGEKEIMPEAPHTISGVPIRFLDFSQHAFSQEGLLHCIGIAEQEVDYYKRKGFLATEIAILVDHIGLGLVMAEQTKFIYFKDPYYSDRELVRVLPIDEASSMEWPVVLYFTIGFDPTWLDLGTSYRKFNLLAAASRAMVCLSVISLNEDLSSHLSSLSKSVVTNAPGPTGTLGRLNEHHFDIAKTFLLVTLGCNFDKLKAFGQSSSPLLPHNHLFDDCRFWIRLIQLTVLLEKDTPDMLKHKWLVTFIGLFKSQANSMKDIICNMGSSRWSSLMNEVLLHHFEIFCLGQKPCSLAVEQFLQEKFCQQCQKQLRIGCRIKLKHLAFCESCRNLARRKVMLAGALFLRKIHFELQGDQQKEYTKSSIQFFLRPRKMEYPLVKMPF